MRNYPWEQDAFDKLERLFLFFNSISDHFLFLPPCSSCKSWMKVYLFELLLNVHIYVHLMILQSYYALMKKKNNCTYFAEPMSYINIYTVHISITYIIIFILDIFFCCWFHLLLLFLLRISMGLVPQTFTCRTGMLVDYMQIRSLPVWRQLCCFKRNVCVLWTAALCN